MLPRNSCLATLSSLRSTGCSVVVGDGVLTTRSPGVGEWPILALPDGLALLPMDAGPLRLSSPCIISGECHETTLRRRGTARRVHAGRLRAARRGQAGQYHHPVARRGGQAGCRCRRTEGARRVEDDRG